MNQPCPAPDRTSTRRIEEIIAKIQNQGTIVIVTQNMQQAQRVSEGCAFFLAAEGTPGTSWNRAPQSACSTPGSTRAARTAFTATSADRDAGLLLDYSGAP
jgi:phosphate transport system ATP-binding protein